MESAHRAPIVDSTLSGCSALSQTGLAHHTSDIFNIQFSISNIEYWISTIFESQLSVHPSVLSSLTDFTRGADKIAKLSLEHSRRPQTPPFTWPQRHTPPSVWRPTHSRRPSHTLHTWPDQHTSCYVLIAYWFLEAQEKAPQQTKYDSLMESEWSDKPASKEAPWYCRDNEEADPTQTPENLLQW